MAAPALSSCLPLLVLFLPLAILQASSVVNGEDPGTWTVVLSLGRWTNPCRIPFRTPASGQRPISWGRRLGREEARAMEPEIRCTTFPLGPSVLSLLHPCVSSSQRKTLAFHACPASACLRDLAGTGLSVVLSEMDPLSSLLPTSSSGRHRVQGAGSRELGGGRAPGVPRYPPASNSCLVLSADTSKLTCFYNSKANISCVWSWDGDLQATSCKIHAQPDRR